MAPTQTGSPRVRIAVPSVAERVAEELRYQLAEGMLLPGARLTEATIAEDLGVSRNTVREAFAELASERLVVRLPNRGVFVANLDAGDIHDVYTVRRAIEVSAVRGGGIVVETRADEFFAVFTEPGAALDAAIAIQRDLRARSWDGGLTVRVRIGIHSGEPTVTDANYIGMDVHAAARICAAAHGGQIVVSSATRQAAMRTTQTVIRYRSLGAHRLRGIPDPMTLFQVGAKGLAAKFPPPRKS